MVGPCGKWLTVEEFLALAGVSESETANLLASGKLVTKMVGEREFVWVDSPDCFMNAIKNMQDHEKKGEDKVPGTETTEARPEVKANAPTSEVSYPNSSVVSSESALEKSEAAEEGEEKAPPSAEPHFTRITGPAEMALQVERAISLVERSLSAFMRMHEEVLVEKDRAVERSREGLAEKEALIKEKEEEVQKLKQLLKEKEQEIADLKMLAEILEERAERGTAPPTRQGPERASVGDLMEEQLRYLMEDQMIKELLK